METETSTTIAMQDKNIDKNIDPVSFFEKDANFVFVFKKTQKLATALYMVTNFLPDNEPLKWTLRKKTSEFLSFMVSYKNILGSVRIQFVLNAKTQVLEILSFLEIAMGSSMVSSMNFSILKQEFLNLISTLDKFVATVSEDASQSILSEAFFDIPKDFQKTDIGSLRTLESPQIGLSGASVKDKETSDFVGNKSVFKKNNRQNIILQMLKKKKDLSIKDIAEVIKDCSEKTIQRELISLIVMGILKKTGERRWSRYSLISFLPK